MQVHYFVIVAGKCSTWPYKQNQHKQEKEKEISDAMSLLDFLQGTMRILDACFDTFWRNSLFTSCFMLLQGGLRFCILQVVAGLKTRGTTCFVFHSFHLFRRPLDINSRVALAWGTVLLMPHIVCPIYFEALMLVHVCRTATRAVRIKTLKLTFGLETGSCILGKAHWQMNSPKHACELQIR